MAGAAKPENESERLATLRRYAVLDTAPEQAFDRITALASRLLGTPIALVSLVDESRQWFKSRVGLDASETPRQHAFCAHAILDAKVMEVPDATADPRFADNPLVVGSPDIRFYAGAPLMTKNGGLGTLCVIDQKPRTLTDEDRATLRDLAAMAVDALELRRSLRQAASAEAELRERNTELQQFAHAAAHDLGKPLYQMTSFAELLVAEAGLRGEEAKMLNFIAAGSHRMTRLLDGMLRFSRVSTIPGPTPPLDAPTAIAEVLADLGPAIEKARASVVVDPQLPRGSMDHDHFRQLIQNLVSNALKFAGRERAKIRIFGESQYSVSRFSVSDQGIGIPAPDRARVFTLFRRLHDSPEIPGEGVGLALCHRIVTRNGGKIWVEPNESAGVTFHFTVPRPQDGG